MKKILLILIISISLTSYGKSINKEQLHNKNGVYYEINKETPYTGKAIAYYKDGQIVGKQNYKNGLENGEWIEYYENGQVKVKENYKNGLIY